MTEVTWLSDCCFAHEYRATFFSLPLFHSPRPTKRRLRPRPTSFSSLFLFLSKRLIASAAPRTLILLLFCKTFQRGQIVTSRATSILLAPGRVRTRPINGQRQNVGHFSNGPDTGRSQSSPIVMVNMALCKQAGRDWRRGSAKEVEM